MRTSNAARAAAGNRGFSLIELLVAMAITVVVTGATFQLISDFQTTYASNVMRADLHAGLRTATQLLAQEIGQAGLLNATPTALATNVAASATAQTVAVASTANLFVGEKLQIDLGASQEIVAITAIGNGTITGVFLKAHSTGNLMTAPGVFPQGILSSSTATQLQLVGDLNADGTLEYVRYDCNTGAGAFSRSATGLPAAAASAAVVLLDTLVANPGGTPCFAYTSTTVSGWTFVTSVGVTLTAQTAQRDPRTKQFVQETKAFLNLSPRNILMGLSIANGGVTALLQPTPPGVPLP